MRFAMSTDQFGLFLGMIFAGVVSASPLAAQTKPKILEAGIERPASAIFIGNSFFYYNNGITTHFTQLLRSADADYKFRSTMVTIGGLPARIGTMSIPIFGPMRSANTLLTPTTISSSTSSIGYSTWPS